MTSATMPLEPPEQHVPTASGVSASPPSAAAAPDGRLQAHDAPPAACFVGLHAQQRYTPADGLVEASVEGRRVLFSTRSGRMYSLNETACRTWMALRVVTAASAAAMLAAEFDVPLEQARRDVMALVSALCDAGLLAPAR